MEMRLVPRDVKTSRMKDQQRHSDPVILVGRPGVAKTIQRAEEWKALTRSNPGGSH